MEVTNLFINPPLTAIFRLSQAQQNNKLKSTISYLGNMNGTDSWIPTVATNKTHPKTGFAHSSAYSQL